MYAWRPGILSDEKVYTAAWATLTHIGAFSRALATVPGYRPALVTAVNRIAGRVANSIRLLALSLVSIAPFDVGRYCMGPNPRPFESELS